MRPLSNHPHRGHDKFKSYMRFCKTCRKVYHSI